VAKKGLTASWKKPERSSTEAATRISDALLCFRYSHGESNFSYVC
jgi:hypothetical protein